MTPRSPRPRLPRALAAFAVGLTGLAACRATPDPTSAGAAPSAVAASARASDGTLAQDDAATRALHASLMRWADAERLSERPLGAVAVALGTRLRGTPYVAGVLDAPREETLLAPLDKFDCVLFVEAVLSMARGVVSGDTTYAAYLAGVEQQRYRGGARDGYGSRLHYFSDWIDDNAARGLAEDVTAAAPGSAAYTRPVGFMSAHPDRYPHLSDAAALASVREAETRLNAVARTFVAKARVRAAFAAIEEGDVIATTTSLDGLDVTHVGFATKAADGTVGFLHASPQGGVKTSPDLAAYLAGNRAQSGIFIVRPR